MGKKLLENEGKLSEGERKMLKALKDFLMGEISAGTMREIWSAFEKGGVRIASESAGRMREIGVDKGWMNNYHSLYE